MIKIIADNIYYDGLRVGTIVIPEGTLRDKVISIITGEIEREPEVMELVLQYPGCLTDFEEEVTV